MTRGHVSQHATTSRLAEPVFGRRRIGAVSSDTFDWPFGPRNTQASQADITSHKVKYTVHQQQLLVTPGKVTLTTNMFSCRSPVRAIIAPLTITLFMVTGVNIPVRVTMMPGVLWTDSTLTNLHNQLLYNVRNNVTRCHIQNEVSWPTVFSLMNSRRLTVLSLTQCHVCQH